MDIVETRRVRLNRLVEHLANDNVTEFAKKFGYSRSQIYQFLSRTYNNGKSMGERAARELEKRTGYPQGWLDAPLLTVAESVSLDDQTTSENGTVKEQTPIVGIPVLGDVSIASDGMIADNSAFRTIYSDKWLKIRIDGRDLFSIRNIGAGQAPRLKSGEYLVVERFVAPRPGDDVLVKTVDGDRYILQFLYIRNKEMVFGAINDPTPSLSITEDKVFSCERIIMILDEIE